MKYNAQVHLWEVWSPTDGPVLGNLKKKMGVCRSKWENGNQENCLQCVFYLLSSFSSSILFFYLSPILSISSPPGPFSFSLPSNNQEVRELNLIVYSCHYDVILRQGMVN